MKSITLFSDIEPRKSRKSRRRSPAMAQVPGRLRWQCRRGMLELDVILNHFVDQYWHSLDNELKVELEKLLCCSDLQLQKWLCEGREADHEISKIVTRMRQTDSHLPSQITDPFATDF